ncbi:hypothetical protein [Streptomyces europaeiscabiei]|uniref:hypothetical protein n=1 Tax=Streptomyces europaeiscabiei TaxID=146819 RepID=UPI002E18F27B
MSRVLQEAQPLLAEHGHTIPLSTARFRTTADVTAFLTLEATQHDINFLMLTLCAPLAWRLLPVDEHGLERAGDFG